jgi:hypothetical protein
MLGIFNYQMLHAERNCSFNFMLQVQYLLLKHEQFPAEF